MSRSWRTYPPKSKDTGRALRAWLPLQILATVASIPFLYVTALGTAGPVLMFGVMSLIPVFVVARRWPAMQEAAAEGRPRMTLADAVLHLPTESGTTIDLTLDDELRFFRGQHQIRGGFRIGGVWNYVWLELRRGETRVLILGEGRLPPGTPTAYQTKPFPGVPKDQLVRTASADVVAIVDILREGDI